MMIIKNQMPLILKQMNRQNKTRKGNIASVGIGALMVAYWTFSEYLMLVFTFDYRLADPGGLFRSRDHRRGTGAATDQSFMERIRELIDCIILKRG
jgi:hypothetical protein